MCRELEPLLRPRIINAITRSKKNLKPCQRVGEFANICLSTLGPRRTVRTPPGVVNVVTRGRGAPPGWEQGQPSLHDDVNIKFH